MNSIETFTHLCVTTLNYIMIIIKTIIVVRSNNNDEHERKINTYMVISCLLGKTFVTLAKLLTLNDS